MILTLRATIPSDLPIIFRIQADERALQMAAFTAQNPLDEAAYLKKWNRLLEDETVHFQTILVEGDVIGFVAKFLRAGTAEITYTISRAYWGRGYATEAVARFLLLETTRPLEGRTVYDNLGSQRVLEKNGFVKVAEGKGFSNVRNKEVVEFIYTL